MKRGLFCVLCVFVCLNFAWGQRVAEEVWTDTIGYQQWQARWSEKDDTVWFVNYHYWEGVTTQHELVFKFLQADMPLGYDQLEIDWGDATSSGILVFNGDDLQVEHTYGRAGIFDLKVTLTSSLAYPPLTFYQKEFNQDLQKCEVEVLNREPKNRCMEYEQDTFWIKLKGTEANPPHTKYTLTCNISSELVSAAAARKDTLFVADTTNMPDVWMLIMRKPVGQYGLSVGFRMVCSDQFSAYFLFNNTDFTPLYIYDKPKLSEIFNYDYEAEEPIRICTGNEAFVCDKIYNNMYMDWQGFPSYMVGAQMKFTFYRAEEPVNPVWEEIPVTHDKTVVDSARLIFNAPGYYKIKIIAENFCGRDTLETDSVFESMQKRPIEVYENGLDLPLACVTDQLCIKDNPVITLSDPARRIKFERWPEYKIEVTRSGTDDVSEPVGYELVSQQMFKADAEVSYPEACDSSKVNLKIREAGVFEIKFTREHNVCGTSQDVFTVCQGGIPTLAGGALVDSLISSYDIVFRGGRASRCDTFSYVLQDFQAAIDSNNLSVDSIAFVFKKGLGPLDTVIFREGDLQTYRFDSVTENLNYIEVKARNYCGWSDSQSLGFYTFIKPDVRLLRNGLEDNDTLCSGTDYEYKLAGTIPESYYIETIYTRLNQDFRPIDRPVEETQEHLSWTRRWDFVGIAEEKIILRHGLSPDGCMQILIDTVYIGLSPDGFKFADSLRYCDRQTEVTVSDLFSEAATGYRWAEWQWRQSDPDWQKASALPSALTFTPGMNDTLYVKLSLSKGCYIRDSLIFIPKAEPVFSVLKERDTFCVIGTGNYPVWDPLAMTFPAEPGVKVDLKVGSANADASSFLLDKKDIPSDYQLVVTTDFPDSLKMTYRAYHSETDVENSCVLELSRKLILQKPYLRIMKTDTLDDTAPGRYDFTRMDGYIDSKYVDEATFVWSKRADLTGHFDGNSFVLSGEDLKADSLVFYLEAQVSSSYCGGEILRDSLIVYSSLPKIYGGKWAVCDDSSCPLWGKAYGYFIEETNLKWKLLNTGEGWGRIEPDRGFGVVYTPEPGKRVGSGDTVKIELDYADGMLKDTVYLKINAALTWALNRDTLIAKERQINVNRIAPDFFTCDNYQRLVIEKTGLSNDAFVERDSILNFGMWDLDFGRNFQVKTRIKMIGLPGCPDAYSGNIEMIDLVNVQPHARTMMNLCAGDSVETTSMFNYEVADRYTVFEWEKEGVDGSFNGDSSYYYVSGNGGDHRLKIVTRKTCTFYDGTVAGANFRKESLVSDYFKTYHNPGLSIERKQDTLCPAEVQVENIIDHWGVRLQRPEYMTGHLYFNDRNLLPSQIYHFNKNAGESDTVLVSVDLGACRYMDWQVKDTVVLYKQRQMITGEFAIPGLCGERWTDIDRHTLNLVDYSGLEWSAVGADISIVDGNLMPRIQGKEDFVSGSVTLTVKASEGCPEEVLTRAFTRTVLPEIALADQVLCPEAGMEITIPVAFLKMRENIDRIDWKIFGTATPFLTTDKETESIVYTLTAADVSRNDFGIVAEVYAPGVCADEPTGDSVNISFREVPEIDILESVPFVCQGDSVRLEQIAVGTDSEVVSWHVVSGDGRLTDEYYLPGEGNGEVRLQIVAGAKYGCHITRTEEVVVQIRPAPVPGLFTVSEPRCPGMELVFSTDVPAGNYVWDFADGSLPESGAMLTHRYEKAGIYPVMLTSHYANGCVRSRRENVVVGALLKAGLNIVPETEDCRQIVRYVENTTEGVWTYAKINWGDSDEWQNIEEGNPEIIGHRFTNDSTVVLTYPIRLIVGNACQEDTAYTDLKVYPLQVKARIGISDDPAYAKCFGQNWGFLNRSFGFGNARYEALWTLEPGVAYQSNSISDSLVEHRFAEPGEYKITLTVKDKCNSDSISQVITVLGNDKLDFSIPGDVLCSDRETALSVKPEWREHFSGFRWDFGDGSPIITNKDSVVHVFKNAGSYRVTLKANALSEGYCPVEKVSSVVIHKTPGAGIRVEPAARGCAPDTVRFIRVFQGEETDDPAEQVYWDFRNGVTAASNDVDGVVFELPGEYKVLLKVTSGAGCVGSDSVSVMTLETPVAGFIVSDTLFCTDDGVIQIGLDNRTPEPEKNSFEWSYNGTLFSRLFQPEILTPAPEFGKIQIKLTAYNNATRCPDVFVKDVVSSRLVKVDFSVTPHEICDATPVHFESTSLYGEGARWDMGDGNIMTESSFDYLYEGEGVYTIRIVANNAEGCVSEKTETVTVYPLPTVDFSWDKDNSVPGDISGNTELPEIDNGGVRFTNLSDVFPKTWGDSLRYVWDFGDNSAVVTQESPYHRFRNNGVYEVVLKGITQYGCVDSVSDRISVSAVKGLFIPTAFAPGMPDDNMGEGGDYRGIARFQPKGVGLHTYKIQIYDAWGGCVWSSDKVENGHPAEYWDGTFNGAPVPKGNYTWKVSATFIDGSVWNNDGGKTEGSVMLIR